MPDEFSGGRTSRATVAGSDSDAGRRLLRENPERQFILPDTLRPQTVGWFAPFSLTITSVPGGQSGVLLRPDPMRVGVLFHVEDLAAGRVGFGVTGVLDGNTILSCANGETRSGMLADLFSLCMAGWQYTTLNPCTITCVEFVRRN